MKLSAASNTSVFFPHVLNYMLITQRDNVTQTRRNARYIDIACFSLYCQSQVYGAIMSSIIIQTVVSYLSKK